MDSTDDFYFDVLWQVRLPRWSSGRAFLASGSFSCESLSTISALNGLETKVAFSGMSPPLGDGVQTPTQAMSRGCAKSIAAKTLIEPDLLNYKSPAQS